MHLWLKFDYVANLYITVKCEEIKESVAIKITVADHNLKLMLEIFFIFFKEKLMLVIKQATSWGNVFLSILMFATIHVM